MIYPDRIKEFKSFQRMFAENIREGGWSAQALIDSVSQHNLLFGVQDLKAYFRGCKYVDEILKLLSQKPDHF